MSHTQLAAPDVVVVDPLPAFAIHIGVVSALVGDPALHTRMNKCKLVPASAS
jgi:hypothetical protein